jgi:hypothetical protein
LSENITDNPIVVPANTTIETGEQMVSITKIDISFYKSLLGNIYMDVVGAMKSVIGDGFVTPFEYEQKHVPASFQEQ